MKSLIHYSLIAAFLAFIVIGCSEDESATVTTTEVASDSTKNENTNDDTPKEEENNDDEVKNEEDDKEETDDSTSSTSFSATVDGTPWQASRALASAFGSTVTISAFGSNPSSLILSVNSMDQPGTYNFSFLGTPTLIATTTGNTSYATQSGQLTITSNDITNKRIQGTFNAVLKVNGGTQTITVTDGAFDITYTSIDL